MDNDASPKLHPSSSSSSSTLASFSLSSSTSASTSISSSVPLSSSSVSQEVASILSASDSHVLPTRDPIPPVAHSSESSLFVSSAKQKKGEKTPIKMEAEPKAEKREPKGAKEDAKRKDVPIIISAAQPTAPKHLPSLSSATAFTRFVGTFFSTLFDCAQTRVRRIFGGQQNGCGNDGNDADRGCSG